MVFMCLSSVLSRLMYEVFACCCLMLFIGWSSAVEPGLIALIVSINRTSWAVNPKSFVVLNMVICLI